MESHEHDPASRPTIHEASRLTDGTGAIEKGAELHEAAAVNRRMMGLDVVICGDDAQANRQQALKIEAAVGLWMRQQRHTDAAGPKALPHFQQRMSPPAGHTFYETRGLKARKRR